MENNFSKNLRHLRVQNGMTQEELGKLLNKDYSTVGKWENGTRSPIMEDVIKIADFFDVPLQELIGGTFIKSKSSNDFKKILKDKGLLDDNDNLTEEDAKKLIDFAIANKDFIINKKEN